MKKPKAPALTVRDMEVCHKKRQYHNQGDAKRSELFFRRTLGKSLSAYRCPICRRWHLGHTNKQDGERERAVTVGRLTDVDIS